MERAILDLLSARWSARAIDPTRPVAREALMTVLEAARWAPSSGNAQPWRYIVYDHEVPQAQAEARAALNRGNAWARNAPVLLLSVALTTWPDSDEPNPLAQHDVGAASMALCLQATATDLVAHQMAGFDRQRMRQVAALPAHAEPMAMIALGHPGSIQALPDKLQQRERRPRRRRSLDETAWLATFEGAPLR